MQSTWASVQMQCGPTGPKNTQGGSRKRHRLKHKGDSIYPAEGDVVIIKSEVRSGDHLSKWLTWFCARSKLCTPKSVIKHPVQHLYPFELTCARQVAPATLKTTVPAFATRACIQELAQMDDERLFYFCLLRFSFLALLADRNKIASKTFALSSLQSN